ncbi:MAG: hypothetical protein E7413_05270 [Ruminococcaceae bacterium]|nr:hypothetical protein [Oscillospiraceae bacterium]
MGYVISFFWIWGIIFLAINHNLGQLTNIITTATANCASFVLKLLFLTAFFSGMIKIAEEIGLTRLLSKLLSPILAKIFKTKNQKTLQKISVNISANMLGIGNAATPSGLAAMEELDKEVKSDGYPTPDMCRFILFNTCSVQLIPTTVIGLRAMAGSVSPSAVVIPVLVTGFLGLISALFLCKLALSYQKWRTSL